MKFPEESHAEPESKAEGLVLDTYKLPQGRDLTVRTECQPTYSHIIIFVVILSFFIGEGFLLRQGLKY